MRPATVAFGLIGFTLVLFLPAAVGDPPKPAPAAPSETPAEVTAEAPRLRMRVFDPERVTADAILPVFRGLLGPADAMTLVPAVPSSFGSFGGSGGFGGSGAFGSNYPMYTPRPSWRVAVAPTGKVVLRGSDRNLAAAAEIVRILDRPAGTPVPQGKFVRVLTPTHLSAVQTRKLATELGFDTVLIHPVDGQGLLVAGPATDLDQFLEAVKLWDVADRK